MFQRITAVLILLFLIIPIAAVHTGDPVGGPGQYRNAASENDIIPIAAVHMGDPVGELEQYRSAASENDLELYAHENEFEFALADKKTGAVWYSCPVNKEDDSVASGMAVEQMFSLITILYKDSDGTIISASGYTESVEMGGASTELIADGIKYKFNFPLCGITIPLQITLSDGKLTASVNTSDIKITKEDVRLLNIGILPFFGAGAPDEKGYLFVPDSCGALINFNNGKNTANTYIGKIYGSDKNEAEELRDLKVSQVKMPVFGIKKEKSALFAVVRGGDACASIYARGNGQTTNNANVYADFNIVKYGTYNVLIDKIEIFEDGEYTVDQLSVEYYFLNSDEADYSGMARKYRSILLSDGFLMSKTPKKPLILDVYGGLYKTKSFIGIPYKGVVPLTTLNDLEEMMSALTEAEINEFSVCYKAWNDEELKGKPVKSLKFSSRLGSVKKYNSISARFKEFPIYLSFENFMSASSLGLFSMTKTSKMLSKTESKSFVYSVSTGKRNTAYPVSYLLAPETMAGNALKAISSLEKKKIDHIGFSDISTLLYSDMSKQKFGTNQVKQLVEEILDHAKDKQVMCENANIYAVKNADVIMNVPASSNRFDNTDLSVPFYQMVISGIAGYSSPAINLQADQRLAFLNAVETGSALSYSFASRNYNELKGTALSFLYSADYRDCLDSMKELYEQYVPLFYKIKDSYIVSHETITSDVRLTTYQNGVKVYVNYSDAEYALPSYSKSIEAHSFIVV